MKDASEAKRASAGEPRSNVNCSEGCRSLTADKSTLVRAPKKQTREMNVYWGMNETNLRTVSNRVQRSRWSLRKISANGSREVEESNVASDVAAS